MNTRGSKHLSLQDRMYIENSINVGMLCKHIANHLYVDDRTISKKIQKHRIQSTNGRYGTYGSFDNTPCKTINRFPFVCNACKNARICKKQFRYKYDAKVANEEYLLVLKDSRSGIDIIPEDKSKFDAILNAGVKMNQSINHILDSNDISLSKSTMYRWINEGKTDINRVQLHRAAKLKPRKHQYEYKEDNRIIRQGRKYTDFLNLMNKNPFANVVEMDTVESTSSGSHKCLLTIHFVSLHFMLIYVLDRKTKDNVSNVFILLQKLLGTTTYKKLFGIILTDRGTEFCDPLSIETHFNTHEKLGCLFYCNSYASYQKGAIEENHELIRKIIPKGILFDDLTQDRANLMASHINSYYRKSIDGYPVDYFIDVYGKKIMELLSTTEVPKDKVTLKPTIIK